MPFQEDEWGNGELEFGGSPAWLRLNQSIGNIAREQYPIRLMVTMAFEFVYDDGLPTEEENLAGGEFEEQIAVLLERDLGAVFAFVLTSDGCRDMFFFLESDPGAEVLEEKISSLNHRFGFEVDIADEDDPWSLYDSFVEFATD